MRILLIEDDEKECNIYKEIEKSRNDIEFVAITKSSNEAIEYLNTYKPDGIILDLELNLGEGNGFDFIEKYKNLSLKSRPKIVVTTNVCSDFVYEYFHQNKVDFIFYKKQSNYSQANVINTLLLLNEYKSSKAPVVNKAEEERDSLSTKINEELDLIGVALHLQGRKYLFDAIWFVLTDEDSEISIIQYLVNKYKKSSSTISRAMQNAILHAWRISSVEDLCTHYTAKINYETGVPTPTEFIYYYADKIKKKI